MNIGLFILNIIYLITTRLLSFIHRKKPPSIPPTTDALLTFSAVTLAKKIRKKEITSYEVVNAYIKRIKEVEPFIHAVVDDRFENAIIEAKTYDEQLRAGKFDVKILEKEKPLFGVPITVKECCPVKGLSYTGCTLDRKGIKATDDASIVKSLRNAGAIPLCVTNMPELCGGFDSNNLIYGHTCNPYDGRYTSGGSTGGEGALIGAGASLIGIGSDLGGSIRIPALFCGIFGLKPTTEIIPSEEHMPWSTDKNFKKYLTFGPMARYAEDLSPMLKIMATRCDRDLRLDEPVNLKLLNVYYQQSIGKVFGVLPVSPEIQQCVLKAADHFAENGVRTEKLPIHWPAELVDIILASLLDFEEKLQMLIDSHNLKPSPLIEMGRAFLGKKRYTKSLLFFALLVEKRYPYTKGNIANHVKKGAAIRKKLMDLLGENGVFVYPTFRIPAPFPGVVLYEVPNSMPYCALANVFGFPSVHVPMGLNSRGLPIGVQVIAAPYQDRLCLAVAKEMEKAFGGWVPPSVSTRG